MTTVSAVIGMNDWEHVAGWSPGKRQTLTFASKVLASADGDGKVQLHPDVSLLAGQIASRHGPWGWQLTWDGEDRNTDRAGIRRDTRLLVEHVDSTDPDVLAYVGDKATGIVQTAWLVTVTGDSWSPDEFMFFAFGDEPIPGRMMLTAKRRAGDGAGGPVPILQARPLTAADVLRLTGEG